MSPFLKPRQEDRKAEGRARLLARTQLLTSSVL